LESTLYVKVGGRTNFETEDRTASNGGLFTERRKKKQPSVEWELDSGAAAKKSLV
jgi:hypothetical protein